MQLFILKFPMKPFLSLCFAVCIILSVVSCEKTAPDDNNTIVPINWDSAKFEISTGLNIGGWLSQTSTRKENINTFFTRSTVNKLAEWGFDHIRLPIDEAEVMNEDGTWIPDRLKLIHNAIGWCKNENLRVILDLHITRSHYFNSPETNTLWTEKASQDKFVVIWQTISAEFKKYPNSLLAYELLNEPATDIPDDWNRLLARTLTAIRANEPERIVILDPVSHSNIGQLKNLVFPEDDKNLMLTTHFYTPHLLTHYQANWMEGLKNLTIPLHYPGQLVAQEDYDTITIQKHKDVVRYYNGVYNKEVLLGRLQEAIRVSQLTGLQVHIGEVGCIDKTPTDVRNAWMTDVIAIMKENNIAFDIWGYKSNFGILTDYGTPKDKNLIDIITAK